MIAPTRGDDPGVDAEQLVDGDLVAGLLANLPPRRPLRFFAGFETAAGERPRGTATFIPMGEQDAVLGVDDDGVCRDAKVHAA